MATAAQRVIREAVAVFSDPDKLGAAVSDLQGHGFDRSEISVMAKDDPLAGHTAEAYADIRQAAEDPGAERQAVVGQTDLQQGRILGTSLASVIAAFAAAGITVATGGAAVAAIAAAIAAGGGAGAVGALVGKAADQGQAAYLNDQLQKGGVLLWVRTRSPAAERRATEILRRHGASNVHVHDMPTPVLAR